MRPEIDAISAVLLGIVYIILFNIRSLFEHGHERMRYHLFFDAQMANLCFIDFWEI